MGSRKKSVFISGRTTKAFTPPPLVGLTRPNKWVWWKLIIGKRTKKFERLFRPLTLVLSLEVKEEKVSYGFFLQIISLRHCSQISLKGATAKINTRCQNSRYGHFCVIFKHLARNFLVLYKLVKTKKQ